MRARLGLRSVAVAAVVTVAPTVLERYDCDRDIDFCDEDTCPLRLTVSMNTASSRPELEYP